MKNKKLKQKQRKQKTKITFPQQLQREDLFKCPIWFADEPGFVKDLNKAYDSYIEECNQVREMLKNKKKSHLEEFLKAWQDS